MADTNGPAKVSAAHGWPMIKGEYHAGSDRSCVAVVTCGSHLDDAAILEAGAAISGSCKTENLGIEKLVIHIVSNPNIRFLIVTGTEVKGHITGEAILMLHKNGVSDNRIVGAKGAIPYIENLDPAAIERFREQVECIDLINVEDIGRITQAVRDCIAQDPGAFPGEPILPRAGGGETGSAAGSDSDTAGDGDGTDDATPGIGTGIVSGVSEEDVVFLRLKAAENNISRIGELNKFKAGIHSGKIEGFVIGFVFMMILTALLIYGVSLLRIP
ncbi:MAG: tetrahydromethanopterin S-methyltransferase subunit A [Methanosarcinaceae archaeon]|nr:tetrahydromethanopterin S-methyltransferase subunit A [Methanosarcinaceae archaeon]